jgi:SAM-dependent methyltransferase
MRVRGTQWRGVVDALRMGRVPARALAIADSRVLVRSMFLASAVRIDVLPFLRGGRPFSEIERHTGCSRPERLRAWLWIGSELGELSLIGGRYGIRGRRARALADGDRFLVAHYRSMLEYQIGPYGQLDELLHADAGAGRADLPQYADDIAEVSLAAAPFVSSFVRRFVTELRPANVLDIGCSTGVYAKVVAQADLRAHIDGIDLSEDVITAARGALEQAGYGSRIALHVGDARPFVRASPTRFDLVMLLNNIYYFERESRAALYRDIGETLTDRGQLLIVSMVAPGSVAAAHLHFMLTCQAGRAALPSPAEIESDLADAGFRVVANEVLVPTEPFVGLRAIRR